MTVTGWIHNPHTCSTEIWYEDRLIGACSDEVPNEGRRMWGIEVLGRLSPDLAIEILMASRPK